MFPCIKKKKNGWLGDVRKTAKKGCNYSTCIVNLKIHFIISLSWDSDQFLRELLCCRLHRGLSFKHANRWEASHKCLIETLLSLWIREHPCAPDDRMSLMALHHCKCRARRAALSLACYITHRCRCVYEWQAAACKWPSACEWGRGALRMNDKWEVLLIGTHA